MRWSNLVPRRAIQGVLGVLLGLCALAPRAQEIRQVGKELAKNFGDAIATVKIVMDNRSGGQSGEALKSETCGTVISPEGLVIVPLFTIDPTHVVKRMMGPMGEALPLNTQVRDIQVGYGKAQPVAATVVLRDNDLNLALLRPLKKPVSPVKFIDLTHAGADPESLDPIIIMTRLGPVATREVALLPSTIQAVVSKPRKFFVPTGGFAGFGIPAFAADGKVLGLCMLQTSLGGFQDLQGGAFSLNLSHMGFLPIILPAAQVQELAAQAPEKADPLPSAEPAKPEKPRSLPGGVVKPTGAK